MEIAFVLITLIIADAVKFITQKIYDFKKFEINNCDFKEWMKDD